MLITSFATGMLRANCYVLAPEPGGAAIVVDPGQSAAGPLRRVLAEHRLTPAAVLLTHGHVDHIWAARGVCDRYGIPAFVHTADRVLLTDPIKGFGPRLGQRVVGALLREPKQIVELCPDGTDTDKVDVAGISVAVDHTPGHTRGSVVFRVSAAGPPASVRPEGANATADTVFTGDTLFRRAVGRTDLWGGGGRDLLTSIATKLLVLDDDTVVLPGHGASTTIGAERRGNPFLEGLRA